MFAYLSGTTFTAYATSQQTIYERMYNASDFTKWGSTFTRGRLGAAVHGYRLLIDWSKRECLCPYCKESPLALILDGVVVGIRRELMAKMTCDSRKPTPGVTARGVPYQERSLIPSNALSPKDWNVLLLFVRAPPDSLCSIGTRIPYIIKDDPAPSRAIVVALIQSLIAPERHPSLRALIPLLNEAVEKAVCLPNDSIVCDPALAHLLYPIICRSTAFVFYKPAETAAALRALIDSKDIALDTNVLGNLQTLLPWLHFFWRDIGLPSSLPPYAKSTCESIVKFALEVAKWEQKYTIDGSDSGPKTLQQLIDSPHAVERAAAVRIVDDEKFVTLTAEEDRKMGIWTVPYLRRRITGLMNYDVGDVNLEQYGQKLPECVKCAPTTHSHSPGIMSAVCTHGKLYPDVLLISLTIVYILTFLPRPPSPFPLPSFRRQYLCTFAYAQ